ncbi:MAG: OsmC family protein [Anaerolineae bacterium]|nr:OsmC family protein [Anaerolineae bacterium]
MIFTGHSSNDFTIPLDAVKAEVGGHNAGIAPMELLLTALGGCTGMDVISILRKKKQQVTAFEVQVEGVLADAHPKVYTEIWVKFILTGTDIDPQAVERSITLSRDKYCGAAATMRHTATMHYDYEIIEIEPAPEE